MNDPYVSIFTGNCLDILPQLEAESVQCVVTSPPYHGLRKYDGDQDYIWNNHNDCEHEWSGHGLISNVRCSETVAGKTRTDDLFYGEESRRFNGNHQKHYSVNSCPKCGAWKGAFGLEPTIDMYVDHTIEILRAIRRVLKPDGIVWWNIGDSYAGSGKGQNINGEAGHCGDKQNTNAGTITGGLPMYAMGGGLKSKDLCLIPFRIALAAQADGWWVRSVIIWSKPNPMPESVKDRPTESHEYILMLTKSPRYYFDAEAVRETQSGNAHSRGDESGNTAYQEERGSYKGFYSPAVEVPGGRNIRSVWEITTQPFKGAHFATFPEEIPRRCILASTSEKGNCAKCGKPWVRILEGEQTGDVRWSKKGGLHRADVPGSEVSPSSVFRTGSWNINTATGWKPSCKCNAEVAKPVVLDPFGGSGTTSKVAKELGRKSIYIDTSEKYSEMARQRIQLVTLPMEVL